MAAVEPRFVPTVLTQGLGFGIVMTPVIWAMDALDGSVPPWPMWTLAYGIVLVLGSLAYGSIYWWLERLYARQEP